ncbi:MAG TPA: VOC family protein [Mycobacteriales bacterium]|nr:VOC family protein [Mycobacteriales bacterium]
MAAKIRLASVALDCADPQALAEFYRAFVGGEIVFGTEEFVAISVGGLFLATVRIPDHRPPTWPGGDRPQQMHLDFSVDDLDAAQARAVELGATPADTQPDPDRWRVLLDPAGHPFCVSVVIPD